MLVASVWSQSNDRLLAFHKLDWIQELNSIRCQLCVMRERERKGERGEERDGERGEGGTEREREGGERERGREREKERERIAWKAWQLPPPTYSGSDCLASVLVYPMRTLWSLLKWAEELIELRVTCVALAREVTSQSERERDVGYEVISSLLPSCLSIRSIFKNLCSHIDYLVNTKARIPSTVAKLAICYSILHYIVPGQSSHFCPPFPCNLLLRSALSGGNGCKIL